jgi:hypothetical protein
MIAAADRKMFAPLRLGDIASPEGKLTAILSGRDGGRTPAAFAHELIEAGLVVGTIAAVTKRIAQLLSTLERDGRVERVPDGRYRTVHRQR